jgi:hypothetical protein
MGTADASGNSLGTNFVAWPGGIGAPTRIPLGGRRKTRRGKQTRKYTRHSRLRKRHTRRR